MKKITAKTTKQELKNMLGANVSAVKEVDKDLFDRIAYADKVSKADDSKVTRKDLVDLVNEVAKVLGDKFVEPSTTPKAENSVKLKGGKKKVEEPKAEEEVTETPAEEPKAEEKVDNKSSKKSLGKKKEQTKDGVTVLNDSKNKKVVQLAKQFPNTLEITNKDENGDDITHKYSLASDIKTMEDLYNAVANGEEIMFAYYWTKRHLKQFPYFNEWLGQPTSFEDDLDLAMVIYMSDELKVSYQVSTYTDAIYATLPEDLVEEDGIRYASGIEFQIYRAV